ncbi:MAG: transaminase [Actinomycetota bacterium]
MAVTEDVDRRRVDELTQRELRSFVDARPASAALLVRARRSMPQGVPNGWMADLFDHDPIFLARGEGAHVVDVDGHRYLDTNIADTSMFCGHSPEPVIRAVAERISLGPQFLMPTEDAIWVAEDLARRWGLPKWRFTLSATAANTEAIRVARHVTGRPKLLMFTGKYHGHADEMLVTERGGELVPELQGLRPGVTEDVRLVPFNDPEALERALAPGDVACVLAEPAMTNLGVIQPEAGFHAALRERTRAAGTLLVLDETHTLICGPGGLVRAWELEPDVVTLGKSIGAGVPIGAYGMAEDVAAPLDPAAGVEQDGVAPEVATGGTLFGNALSMAAARAALAEVLVEEAYERATALGARVADGIEREADRAGLRWRADRLGPRSGYVFGGSPPRDAEDARRGHDAALHRLLRLWMANRGVWEAMEWAGPAMSVAATDADADHYLAVLRDLVTELAS